MTQEFNATRTMLANAMATAGAELLQYMKTAGALAAIPNTDPQQYVVAGTLEIIGKLLPTVAPAVQAQPELTDERIAVIAKSSFLLAFDDDEVQDFARAIEREVRSAARDQARNEAQWISVYERLPEKECLAVYVTPNGKQCLIRAKYARQFQIEAEGDDQCETEYNDDDDTFYIKAGWLECIDNWGEYSSCYVTEGTVTHWMPLPEAPAASKEGENRE